MTTDDLGPVEDRLRQALAFRAAAVEPRAGDVAALEARAAVARAIHRRRLTILSIAAAVAVVAAVAGVLVAVGGDDPEELATGDTSTTTTAPTTSSSTTTSTSTTTTTLLQDDGVPGWPGATARVFDDPEAAALNFITDVLGFAEPTLADVTTEGAESQVVYHPRPTASVSTTVAVHNTGPIRGWVVTGTTSNQGSIDELSFDGTTVNLSGTALAFEATVSVLVLDQEGNILAETFTMAGGTERLPYEASIDVDPGSGTPFWVMIAESDASGEGDYVWAATANL